MTTTTDSAEVDLQPSGPTWRPVVPSIWSRGVVAAVEGVLYLIVVIMVAIVFGRMCRKMTRPVPAPSTSAAAV